MPPPAALPSLSQIPEESPSEADSARSSPITIVAPKTPPPPARSPDPLASPSRSNTNFSRPRTPCSNATSPIGSPTSEHPPNILSAFPRVPNRDNRLHVPKADRAAIAARYAEQNGFRHRTWGGDPVELNQNYDTFDYGAAPAPAIRTHVNHQDMLRQLRPGQPHTWIYKPYADSVLSDSEDDSSVTTDDTPAETDDTASIAETTAVDDFAFDARMGWQARPKVSNKERERDRQRSAAPVIRPIPHRSAKSDDAYTHRRPQRATQRQYIIDTADRSRRGDMGKNTSRPKPPTRARTDYHESWLSSGSEGTARTVRTRSRSTSRDRRPRRAHVDVFQAAAEQRVIHQEQQQQLLRQQRLLQQQQLKQLSLSPGGLNRSASTGTQRSGHSSVGNGMGASDSTSLTSVSSSGEWKSSDVDISSLSKEKLEKLRKKGINPALYLEMKSARGGGGKRKGVLGKVGVLTGNSFVI